MALKMDRVGWGVNRRCDLVLHGNGIQDELAHFLGGLVWWRMDGVFFTTDTHIHFLQ